MDKQQQIIENQVALFNLVSALFYRVTGQVPVVRIKTQNGPILTEPILDDIICQDGVALHPVEHQKARSKASGPCLVS